MRLSGDEDGGVAVECYHSDCDAYRHGAIAYYGGLNEMEDVPNFAQLPDLIAFIQEHEKSHEEAG